MAASFDSAVSAAALSSRALLPPHETEISRRSAKARVYRHVHFRHACTPLYSTEIIVQKWAQRNIFDNSRKRLRKGWNIFLEKSGFFLTIWSQLTK